MKLLRKLGPGLLVTAAFVGPGTVTTASKAGGSFGFSLLWTLVFATVATIVLQVTAARLGLVTRSGLGEAIRNAFPHTLSRLLACGLVVIAIGFGNAAYQTGNVVGAAAALELMLGGPAALWSVMVGVAAFLLLATSTYGVIERVLVALVVLMSIVFLVTAIIVTPDWYQLLSGMFVPSLPPGSLATAIGLIGTTVVPYNLFLHASSASERWRDLPTDEALSVCRLDTTLAVGLGGLATLFIMTTAASVQLPNREINTAGDMAVQLEPLLGGAAASVCFSVGLFAAGLTSAVTAPLAAAYATAGALGWKSDLRSGRFRSIWMLVLVAGTVTAASSGSSPAQTILLAQVANGMLLPVVAVFLLVAANRRDQMGLYANGPLANLLGIGIVLFAGGLGLVKLLQQFGLF